MSNGYISLRELEDSCRVNLRFMYLMDHRTPSYRTFGYFISEILSGSIEEIFCDINKKIFETDLYRFYGAGVWYPFCMLFLLDPLIRVGNSCCKNCHFSP